MPTIVQKFGGTSVADINKIMHCARRVASTREQGHEVCVVVSAMGHTTDELIELAEQITDTPSRREMDTLMSTGEQVSSALMAIALQSLGVEAVSMTGPQIGIHTDGNHRNARIRTIETESLRTHLDRGRVIVAAGFQGIDDEGDITTLGRGGSDTTAVALAAALGVSEHSGVCEIFTDVDGVYTADPRKVHNACKLPRISYEEMLELASAGAAVMHNRAVVFGMNYNVPIHVRHSVRPDGGTMIVRETPEMEDINVIGCALKSDLGRVSIRRVPNTPGIQSTIFGQIAAAGVLVDDIMQTESGAKSGKSGSGGDTADISFTVDHKDLGDVRPAVQKAIEQIGRGEIDLEVGLAKVSIVGMGMRSHTGIAATMFRALGDAGIPINNITTSEIVVSCIMPKEHGERALQIVHDAFDLGRTVGTLGAR